MNLLLQDTVHLVPTVIFSLEQVKSPLSGAANVLQYVPSELGFVEKYILKYVHNTALEH